MKAFQRILLPLFLAFYIGSSFSQTIDSLQISPNPVNGKATIHFEIAQSDTVSLRIFDITGQTVKTFFQKSFLKSGSYDVQLLGDSLVAGIYIVRLDIGASKNITKKVVNMGTPTGITTNKAVDKVLLFPNPTNNYLTIPLVGNKTIVVKDLQGRELRSFTTEQQLISLSDFSSGQYVVTILTNKGEVVVSQKVTKTE